MQTDHSSEEMATPVLGRCRYMCNLQVMKEETCHSVDPCLPKRRCSWVSAIHWCYFWRETYYHEWVVGAQNFSQEQNKNQNKNKKNNCRVSDLVLCGCRWRLVMVQLALPGNGLASFAINSTPKRTPHNCENLHFFRDITVSKKRSTVKPALVTTQGCI